MHNLILFGGSFDPVHYGHLRTALAIQKHFSFQRFVFLPCKDPVLKGLTKASSQQRVEMLNLAINPFSDFSIDLREIQRDGRSYMVDTLTSLRHELGSSFSITLLLGRDAYNQLPQWHQWKILLTLSHLLIMERPESKPSVTADLTLLEHQHLTHDEAELFNKSCGRIFHYNAGIYEISSTWIRKQLKQDANVGEYLPPSIYDYIKRQGLYR